MMPIETPGLTKYLTEGDRSSMAAVHVTSTERMSHLAMGSN